MVLSCQVGCIIAPTVEALTKVKYAAEENTIPEGIDIDKMSEKYNKLNRYRPES